MTDMKSQSQLNQSGDRPGVPPSELAAAQLRGHCMNCRRGSHPHWANCRWDAEGRGGHVCSWEAGRGQRGTGVPWLPLGWAPPSAPPGEKGTEHMPIQNFPVFGVSPLASSPGHPSARSKLERGTGLVEKGLGVGQAGTVRAAMTVCLGLLMKTDWESHRLSSCKGPRWPRPSGTFDL